MTFLATNGVQSYARAVREAMGDLPSEQAHEVLDGLDEHLAEIVAEGTTDLEEVLGSPESYADELRASAGLPAATHRSSWAAPPVELRSDVPTSDGVDEFAEPLAQPRRTGRFVAPLRSKLSTRRVVLSRSFLVVVYGLLLVSLIRASRPLNIFHVVFGTLLIVGAWILLRAASTRADLPAHWVAYAPRVLACTAVVLALVLGSRMGSNGAQYVYVDNAAPFNASTAFATIPSPYGDIAVPNVVGTSLADTRNTLSRFGFVTVVEGGETDLSTRVLTTQMDPAPGTLLQPGSAVRVVVAPVSSLIPTSIVTPTTTASSGSVTAVTPTAAASTVLVPTITPTSIGSSTPVPPAVSVPSVTTALAIVPGAGAGVTVPVVTTIGTTTVAAVPATAAPTPDQTVTK
jgi:hypothetical protein